MPKQHGMAQLSRPFQIALVAVCLLAGVWLFALQGHSASTSGSSAPAPATPASAPSSQAAAPTSASAEAHAAAAPTHVYTGSAPGVHGLSSAVAKAHQAVATSQQNARQVEGKPAVSATKAAPSGSSSSAHAAVKAAAPVAAASKPSTSSTAAKPKGATVPARQSRVEAALAKGDVAVLLFWVPRGADDRAVHRAMRTVLHLDRHILVVEAPPSQVATFGSVTRGVQVYGTPTILIVNRHGQTSSLTGLQDAYSIEQAITEARHS